MSGPSGVPSHNDHPVVIRPKEEAQRCEHRSVKLLCAQFERFERRQWLSDCSGLVMPPAPSEAGSGRNESGTDDKDAHGVISLFGAPQLNQLQSSQLVPGHPLEEAPTTRPGPPPNQAQSAMNTGPEYWLGHLTLLHHRFSKEEARRCSTPGFTTSCCDRTAGGGNQWGMSLCRAPNQPLSTKIGSASYHS